jgi:hypothetical protein
LSKDKKSLVIDKDIETNVLNIAVVDENKVLEMRIRMDQLNVLDQIDFHQKSNDIIYTDLLQLTLNISRIETKVSKLEGKIKKEKVVKKA